MAQGVEIRASTNEQEPLADANGLKVKLMPVLDSAGVAINPDNYAQTLAYNGDGLLETVSFTDGVNTWTQTLTYTGGLLTGVSTWVRS